MATQKTGRPVGRPPKPTEVKRAIGNPGHRPLPEPPGPGEGLAGIPVDGTIPTAPPLGPDGERLWITLWTAGQKWLSTESDVSLITMLCSAVDEAEELRRSIVTGEVKRFYTLTNGQVVTHPVVNQLKDLRAQITAWLSALGFTPTDRARLGLVEVRQPDVLDELDRRRREREVS